MLREKCRACGGTDLYTGRMIGQGSIMVTSPRTIFKTVGVTKCCVCTTCGTVEPYMDDAAIARVKAWKAVEAHQIPDMAASKDDTAMEVHLRIALLVAGLCGVAAAVAVYMWTVAQQVR